MTSVISAEEAMAFFHKNFRPEQVKDATIGALEAGKAEVFLNVRDYHRRPGGSVAGPVLVAMADIATYLATFTRTGFVLDAFTSSLNFNFLRPCQGDVVIATGTLLKLGKKLAVAQVDVRPKGADEPAGFATVTFSLPDRV